MKRRRLLQGAGSAGLLLGLPVPVWSLQGNPDSKTGLVLDPRFLDHMIRRGHPESPDRLRHIQTLFEAEGLFGECRRITPKDHPGDSLYRLHGEDHIDSIASRYPDAHRVALLASGGAIAAAEAIMTGDIRQAFCASRPPGHHAQNTGEEEGFCYYNHIAIVARHLQQQHGLERILIGDWDYHHGDATEAMFYDDPSVLFFSTHDLHAYPGTGHASRRGTGDGEGYSINVPLECGDGDSRIIGAFENRLLPAADTFKPDFVLISAGFDSRKDDPLGCFEVTDRGFTELSRLMLDIAKRHCDGRLLSILEGGYNLEGNAKAAAAHLGELVKSVQ